MLILALYTRCARKDKENVCTLISIFMGDDMGHHGITDLPGTPKNQK